MGLKLIYKKSLMVELVRCGHMIEYSARNRSNPKFQVYFFPHSHQLDIDIAKITGKKYVRDERAIE